MVTAKIVCSYKSMSGEGDQRLAQLSFQPDYQDGRNAGWATATPSLSLSMTVKGAVADRFEQGGRYTLCFTEDEPADQAPVDHVDE